MDARRFIELVPDAERIWAARLAEAWGYPRAISEREVERGIWFRFSDGSGIAWLLEPHPDWAGLLAPGVPALVWHGIGSPAARKRRARVLSPRTAAFVEGYAESLGAQRLYSLVPDLTPGVPAAAMRRYLARYGYVADKLGSYKDLGE